MAYAQMGFVGFVNFGADWGGQPVTVRAESCDLKMKQEIELPNLVDGKYDKTAYFMKPKQIEGALSFPAVAGDGSGAVFNRSFDWAWKRDLGTGRLVSSGDVTVKYFGGFAYRYTGCVVDSWDFSAEQGGMVKINMNLIGKQRFQEMGYGTQTPGTNDYGIGPNYSFQGNSRVIGWNDVQLDITGDGINVRSVDCGINDGIRSFTMNIKNNVQRFYALGCFTPVDVTAGKRDISGTMKVLGINNTLAQAANTNEVRCNAEAQIHLKINPTCTSGSTFDFDKVFGGAIFQIEEISLTNDIVESSINWKALPGCPDLNTAPAAPGTTC